MLLMIILKMIVNHILCEYWISLATNQEGTTGLDALQININPKDSSELDKEMGSNIEELFFQFLFRILSIPASTPPLIGIDGVEPRT